MKLTNVEVTTSEFGQFALGCEYKGARYHVWLDRQTKAMSRDTHGGGTTLFKNSIPRQREAGYFKTRKLDADATFGKQLIAAMMAEALAGDLFNKAVLAVRRDIEKELLEDEITATQKIIEPLAGQFLAALRTAVQTLRAADWTRLASSEFQQGVEAVIAQGQEVLKLADEAEAGVGDRYAEIWRSRLGADKPVRA